jgi:hypothetical protein
VITRRLKTIPPPGQPCFAEAIERSVHPYEATVMKDDAARWHKELEAVRAVPRPGAKP